MNRPTLTEPSSRGTSNVCSMTSMSWEMTAVIVYVYERSPVANPAFTRCSDNATASPSGSCPVESVVDGCEQRERLAVLAPVQVLHFA